MQLDGDMSAAAAGTMCLALAVRADDGEAADREDLINEPADQGHAMTPLLRASMPRGTYRRKLMRLSILFPGKGPADGSSNAIGGAAHERLKRRARQAMHLSRKAGHQIDRRIHQQALHRRFRDRRCARR